MMTILPSSKHTSTSTLTQHEQQQQQPQQSPESITMQACLEDAAQAMRHHPRRTLTRQSCSSGHIESIELVDFMCHRHLLIKLGPHINFIVGNNGSGKSAILTALTVCLGGRASATQRAATLDSLIREGVSTGCVRVRLHNGGDNPYQPQLYGEYIMVERTFRRDGANTYFLHGAHGRIMGMGKKEELMAICDHFGIQVDNPLTVLTQETAKRFLANAKPKELYEFFIKATQLEQLAIDYAFTLDKINEARHRLEQSQNGMQPLRDKIVNLEETLTGLERYRTAHQTIQQLRCELTWAMVREKEEEFEDSKGQLQGKQKELMEMEECLNGTHGELERIERKIGELENAIAKEANLMQPLCTQRTALQQRIKQHEQHKHDLTIDAKQINQEFSTLRRQQEMLTGKIEEEERERERMAAINDGEGSLERLRQELQGQLATLESELLELNGHIADGRRLVQQRSRERGELEGRMEAMQTICQEHDMNITTLQGQLATLQRIKGDRLRSFGERMPEALAEITSLVKAKKASSSSFHRPPIGPVGVHVKLREGKWAMAMEALLARNLEAFITHDHHDRVQLQTILQRHNLNNPIVVLSFEGQLDAKDGRAPARFQSALDLLQVEEPVVRKLLIIMCEAERVVLLEDRQEALRVLSSHPPNVSSIYTPSARLHAGLHSIVYSNLHAKVNGPRLVDDHESRLAELSTKLTEMLRNKTTQQEELSALRKELEQARHLQEEAQQNLLQAEQRLRRNKTETRQIQDRLEELVETLTTLPQSVYEEERRQTEEKMTALAAQFQANDQQQQRLSTAMAELAKQLEELEERISTSRATHSSILSTIDECVGERRRREGEVRRAREEQERVRQLIAERGEILKRAEQQLAEMRQAALRISPPIDRPSHLPTRSVAELDRELTAQEECLRNSHYAQLDPLALRTQLEEGRARLRGALQAISINQDLLQVLHTALLRRQRAWEDFRRSVAKMSSTEFIFMLTARGFRGSLEYRHGEGELHIRVQPAGRQEESLHPKGGMASSSPPSHQNVRQLSGGEKSYSTVCFLFSLWQAMGSPLRCLDEFDVYMDPVNRTFVLDLLVTHARASKVQFVLITPNSIPDAYKTAPDVRIYRLADPDRTQTVLTRTNNNNSNNR